MQINKLSRCLRVLVLSSISTLPLGFFSGSAQAFTAQTGIPLMNGHANHEEITRLAIHKSFNNANARFLSSVIDGNVKMDRELLAHKFDQAEHVNTAKFGNGRFNESNGYIENMISSASALAKNNPRFLSPAYSNQTLSVVVERLRRLNIPDISTLATAVLIELVVHSIEQDRHTIRGKQLVKIRRALDAQRNTLTPELNNYRLELRAAEARQYLGHAFHTLQDFFAHSNVVEILAGKRGPPCHEDHFEASKCDNSSIGSLNQFANSNAVRTFLSQYRINPQINDDNLALALGNTRHRRLQSGYVLSLGDTPILTAKKLYCMNALAHNQGYKYCHWNGRRFLGPNMPAISKDKACENNECKQQSNKNFSFARYLAIEVTATKFDHFMASIDQNLPILTTENRPTINETSGRLTQVPVSLSRAVPYPVSFDYEFSSGANNPNMVTGSGCSGNVDMQRGGRKQAIFRSNQTRIQLSVHICNDQNYEGPEQLTLQIFEARNLRIPPLPRITLTDEEDRPRLKVVGTGNQHKIQLPNQPSLNKRPIINRNSCATLICRKPARVRKMADGRCICE